MFNNLENTGGFGNTNTGGFGNTNTGGFGNTNSGSAYFDPDAEYKNKKEATYYIEIEELRTLSPDIDEVFIRRDEEIKAYKKIMKEYEKLLNPNEDKQKNNTTTFNESNIQSSLITTTIQSNTQSRPVLTTAEEAEVTGYAEKIRIGEKRLEVFNAYVERLAIKYIEEKKRGELLTEEQHIESYEGLGLPVPYDMFLQYIDSPFHDMACNFATMGIPIAGDFAAQYCFPKGPATKDCEPADITQFQGLCYNEYTQGANDNIGGYPQHISWGEMETSPSKCPVGIAGIGRQERGVCGVGYYQGDTNTFNKTRCHLHSDDADGERNGAWATMGDLNNTCAIEVGRR